MKFRTVLLAGTALACGATLANAGGLDRSRLAYGALYEDGRYMELGFSTVNPSVGGAYQGAALDPVAGATLGFAPSAKTGNMAERYQTLSLTYKADLSERLSYSIQLNTPHGADALYSGGLYDGLEAHWSGRQLAALLKYDLDGGVSVHGGVRYLESAPEIVIPDAMMSAPAGEQLAAAVAAVTADPTLFPVLGPQIAQLQGFLAGDATYTASGERDGALGYVIGAAFERKDIALRVGLTYESGMTHKFDTVENAVALGIINERSVTEVEMPQSLTLDFQTGIAADTLLFGSVKYSEWSVWEVAPAAFDRVVNGDADGRDEITGFDNNVITWQLGVGRKINDNLSVFARAGYEKANGGIASRLAPTDGSRSIGIGATWRQDNIKITGGVEYAKLGDAVDASGTRFEGNSALGVGVTVGFSF